jgi:hypothetical protein
MRSTTVHRQTVRHLPQREVIHLFQKRNLRTDQIKHVRLPVLRGVVHSG